MCVRASWITGAGPLAGLRKLASVGNPQLSIANRGTDSPALGWSRGTGHYKKPHQLAKDVQFVTGSDQKWMLGNYCKKGTVAKFSIFFPGNSSSLQNGISETSY